MVIWLFCCNVSCGRCVLLFFSQKEQPKHAQTWAHHFSSSTWVRGPGMACWINLFSRAVPQLCRGRCPDHIKISTCCRCRNYSLLDTRAPFKREKNHWNSTERSPQPMRQNHRIVLLGLVSVKSEYFKLLKKIFGSHCIAGSCEYSRAAYSS